MILVRPTLRVSHIRAAPERKTVRAAEPDFVGSLQHNIRVCLGRNAAIIAEINGIGFQRENAVAPFRELSLQAFSLEFIAIQTNSQGGGRFTDTQLIRSADINQAPGICPREYHITATFTTGKIQQDKHQANDQRFSHRKVVLLLTNGSSNKLHRTLKVKIKKPMSFNLFSAGRSSPELYCRLPLSG